MNFALIALTLDDGTSILLQVGVGTFYCRQRGEGSLVRLNGEEHKVQESVTTITGMVDALWTAWLAKTGG